MKGNVEMLPAVVAFYTAHIRLECRDKMSQPDRRGNLRGVRTQVPVTCRGQVTKWNSHNSLRNGHYMDYTATLEDNRKVTHRCSSSGPRHEHGSFGLTAFFVVKKVR